MGTFHPFLSHIIIAKWFCVFAQLAWGTGLIILNIYLLKFTLEPTENGPVAVVVYKQNEETENASENAAPVLIAIYSTSGENRKSQQESDLLLELAISSSGKHNVFDVCMV